MPRGGKTIILLSETNCIDIGTRKDGGLAFDIN